jgi:acyl-coenzyme A thioesterase 9
VATDASQSQRIIRSRTGITQQLWEMRLRADNSRAEATEQPAGDVEETPADSQLLIELPLSSDASLREQYLSWRGAVRFGKLMEDLDAFAGSVAFLHCDDGLEHTMPQRLVTASIDRIDVRKHIPVEDLVLSGNVTWVGRSSLMVSLSLGRQQDAASVSTSSPIDGAVLTASFVFVALDASGSVAKVNPLRATTEAEQARMEAGAQAAEARKQQKSASLEVNAPSEAETHLIHRILMAEGWCASRRGASSAATGLSPAIAAAAADKAASVPNAHPPSSHGSNLPAVVVEQASTLLTSNSLTQPQERNTAGKVFGGFLCRKAFEVAHSAASIFALRSGVDCVPLVVAADTITFDRPVEVGQILTFTAAVDFSGSSGASAGLETVVDGMATHASYAQGRKTATAPHFLATRPDLGQLCQVRAETVVLDLATGDKFTSNTFHFTFVCTPRFSRSARSGGEASQAPVAESARQDLAAVRPDTYTEAMRFLDGRRRMAKTVAIGRALDSHLVPVDSRV